ncbi:hypothetical protein [Dyadobacter sp. CY326]|uniref:hypothetical protein n=1 Tax=Dyadobacter sp. CY326 TaxID=2907300 RepID=UPI001F232D74|nr:hypothetical protein [Dyadobacter sp. CY326]MCE7064607.1 hypothetical protein [Dyadobacter sp. CY326]
MSLRSAFVQFFLAVSFFVSFAGFGQSVKEVQSFQVAEAKQAVAVDEMYFYVINNSTITKHKKAGGEQVAMWDGTKDGIKHLNSGVVIKGKMYCANTNYPEIPMASSIEIFDVNTMQHIDNHSFGIAEHGSLTWIDQKDGFWWCGFAHYAGKEASEGRDVRWTSVVKFDMEWRQLESWIFPKIIVDLFTPKSNSGGAWGNDNLLYCTGHDEDELYVMKIPKSGFTLEHIATVPAPMHGQGIAMDHWQKNKQIIFGINRAENKIISAEIK